MKENLNVAYLSNERLNISYLNIEGLIRKKRTNGGNENPIEDCWMWDNGENLCWDNEQTILIDK